MRLCGVATENQSFPLVLLDCDQKRGCEKVCMHVHTHVRVYNSLDCVLPITHKQVCTFHLSIIGFHQDGRESLNLFTYSFNKHFLCAEW